MSLIALDQGLEVPVVATGGGRVGVARAAVRMWRTRIGLALLLLIVAVAVLGPLFAPHGEAEYINSPNQRHVEGVRFGTDYFGQDVLSRFLHGGKWILLLSVAATAIALIAGTLIGLAAAYNRGRLDEVLMRVMDVNLAFPQLLLVLVALTTFGPKRWLIVVVVALTTMPRIARISRGAAVPVVERDFVGAAEALGEPRWRILLRELLPNVSGPLLVEANLRLTYTIATIASLGFLGFSSKVNDADWGSMINENRAALSVNPWGTVLPAAAIAVLTVATGLIADGVARATAGIDRAKGDQ